MKRLAVLLADDQAIGVEALRPVLEPEFRVAGVVADGRALMGAAARLRPDIIVVDVSMPVLNGIEAVRRIRKSDRHAKVICLSMHPDVVFVSKALQAGGSAYVLKSSAGIEILTAIREALQGRTFVSPSVDRKTLEAQIRRDQRSQQTPDTLSPRRREVLQLVAEGRSTKEMAELLHISPRTVEFHRYRVMESLGVHTVAELVQYAIKHRILTP